MLCLRQDGTGFMLSSVVLEATKDYQALSAYDGSSCLIPIRIGDVAAGQYTSVQPDRCQAKGGVRAVCV
jgi:hypothetical protein